MCIATKANIWMFAFELHIMNSIHLGILEILMKFLGEFIVTAG